NNVPKAQKEPINAEVEKFNPDLLKKTETKEKNPLPTKAGRCSDPP
uniref:Thymosin beta n=1 Tax=Cyclopterus lumpus TaxID=8103 RepID=A0A8C3AC53_CYCLU